MEDLPETLLLILLQDDADETDGTVGAAEVGELEQTTTCGTVAVCRDGNGG